MENRNGDVIWTINNHGLSQVNYECFKCRERTEGFSICLNCNPQTYEVIGMSKMNENILTKENLEQLGKEIGEQTAKEMTSTFVDIMKIVWNAAIEAAAEVAVSDYHITKEEIRKLKID